MWQKTLNKPPVQINGATWSHGHCSGSPCDKHQTSHVLSLAGGMVQECQGKPGLKAHSLAFAIHHWNLRQPFLPLSQGCFKPQLVYLVLGPSEGVVGKGVCSHLHRHGNWSSSVMLTSKRSFLRLIFSLLMFLSLLSSHDSGAESVIRHQQKPGINC